MVTRYLAVTVDLGDRRKVDVHHIWVEESGKIIDEELKG